MVRRIKTGRFKPGVKERADMDGGNGEAVEEVEVTGTEK